MQRTVCENAVISRMNLVCLVFADAFSGTYDTVYLMQDTGSRFPPLSELVATAA